jgi:Uma2 family endonuclease
MVLTVVQTLISEKEYLAGELVSDIKHELLNGEDYAKAGASKNHGRIEGNINRKMGNFLENSSYEVFSSDIKVKVGRSLFLP